MNYFLQKELEFFSSGDKYIFRSGVFCFWCTFNSISGNCEKAEKAYRLKCHSNIDKNIMGSYTLEKYK